MITAMAIRFPAQVPPNIALAASENGVARWLPGYCGRGCVPCRVPPHLFNAQVAEQGNRDAAADRGDGASPLMFHGVKLALEM